ncbi:putative GEM-like protein 8 [Lotus japonicus]|uniref:putative GEM-like protein 8 n=1 Tax=Lotus japonicus TaxID=34305 RepID=UPI002583D30B|nr:putative GEM-like protein 8 [Lotus japonicus]
MDVVFHDVFPAELTVTGDMYSCSFNHPTIDNHHNNNINGLDSIIRAADCFDTNQLQPESPFSEQRFTTKTRFSPFLRYLNCVTLELEIDKFLPVNEGIMSVNDANATRVAIFRDREKNRSDPDYDHSYGSNDLKGLKNDSSLAYRIHEHIKLGPKLSETLKGKLSLGARIIQEGGRENIFKHVFGMQEEEKLLKASQCYLYTTAGPIAGILFISTKEAAFCSEMPTSFCSEAGEIVKAPYKVLIPIEKIKEVNESMNVNKLEQKYIEIVTKDGSEFWFMGFLRNEKAPRNLKRAVSMGNCCK